MGRIAQGSRLISSDGTIVEFPAYSISSRLQHLLQHRVSERREFIQARTGVGSYGPRPFTGSNGWSGLRQQSDDEWSEE